MNTATTTAREVRPAALQVLAREAPVPSARLLKYMPQLDALRALAVFGVFATHFLPETRVLGIEVHTGGLGVKLFFVLSGYLITRILLNAREQVQAIINAVLASSVARKCWIASVQTDR